MMKWFTFLLALSIVGCLESEKPPFREGDLVFDPAFEGTWESLKNKDGPEKSVALTISRRGNRYEGLAVDENHKPQFSCEIAFFIVNNGLFVCARPKSEKGDWMNYETFRMGVEGNDIVLWSHSGKSDIKLSTNDSLKYISNSIKDCNRFDLRGIPMQRQGGSNKNSAYLSKTRRTFDYWLAMKTIMHGYKDPAQLSREAATAELKRVAQALKDLPTVGVDIEAATCLLQIAHSLDDVIVMLEKGARYGEAFLRGLMGDPFGTAKDLMEDEQGVNGKLIKATRQLESSKVSLTNRYDIQFP